MMSKGKKGSEQENNKIDIIDIIHMVIEEIEEKGVETMTNEGEKHEMEFTDGIMFLLYKKKEKWKI